MPSASVESSWNNSRDHRHLAAVVSASLAADVPFQARAFIGATVAEVEQALILATLDHCDGNRTSTAKILGISLRSLHNKLTSYGAAGVAVPAPQARSR